MHWNADQILWALLLAAHLVLLIVLLGRDRSSRFPWFTAAVALSAVRLIADHLLHGKLTTIAFYWQSYTGIALDAILGIVVLVELCRAVFSSGKTGLLLKPRGWAGWLLVTVPIAAAIVWAWGRPWPTWAALNAEPSQLKLLLTVIFALKMSLVTAILTVETGLLLRIFGKRFGYGWKSHAQQIALGLSTNALGVLAVQAIQDIIRRNIHFTTAQERNALAARLPRLFGNLENARITLGLLVLVWWIFWLWRDEVYGSAAAAVEVSAGNVADAEELRSELRETDLSN